MLDFDKALHVMLSVAPTAEVENVSLDRSLGRVVAETIDARINLPPFSKSAMDGFAVSSADPSTEFRIIETIPAGHAPEKKVGAGECARIMTGAMMPEGADKVIRVEYTQETKGVMTVKEQEKNLNVIRMGENVPIGAPIFEPGVIRPQHIGIFAEQGIGRIPVRVPPLVGVIATGSELKDPGQEIGSGEIYNSNGQQLCAQISGMGGRYEYYGIVEDDPESVSGVLQESLSHCDVTILSGGVSMGDYDYVPAAVEGAGAEILFHKVAVKPGKPLLFARRDDRWVVGLPGNPVSTFIIFEVMVKPMLYRLMGVDYIPGEIVGHMACDIRRRDSSRLEFRPVTIRGGAVAPVSYHGSSHLHALGSADGLISIAPGVDFIPEGREVHVRPI